jgi:hypothetical protein
MDGNDAWGVRVPMPPVSMVTSPYEEDICTTTSSAEIYNLKTGASTNTGPSTFWGRARARYDVPSGSHGSSVHFTSGQRSRDTRRRQGTSMC